MFSKRLFPGAARRIFSRPISEVIGSWAGCAAFAAACAALLPAAAAQIQLGSIAVGATANGTATVTVSQAGTLSKIQVLTRGASGLDYNAASGGSCATGTAYRAGQSCTVEVTFTPKYPGTRFGAVVLDDASGNVLGTAYLQGSGIGAQTAYLPFTASYPPFFCAPGPPSYIQMPPAGVAVDGNGNLYVTCPQDNAIYKETPTRNGQYTATQIGTGVVANDGLFSPQGIAVDGAGNVYIDDSSTNRVVMERPKGSGFKQVDITLTGPQSPLNQPMALAVDGAGHIYIDDFMRSRVIEASPTGPGSSSYFVNELVTNIQSPTGIAVDGSGNVFYTAPTGLDKIFMLANSNGAYTQRMLGSGFNGPAAVGVDGVGNVYVLDAFEALWIERPTGSGGYAQQELNNPGQNIFGGSQPGFPIAVDFAGNVWAIPGRPGALLEYAVGTPPSMSFGYDTLGVADPQLVFGVTDIGNQALDLTQVLYPADFPEIHGVTDITYPPGVRPLGDCASGMAVAVGEYCMVGTEFLPQAPLNGQFSVSLNEDLTASGNMPGSPVEFALSGTETEPQAPTVLLNTNADPSLAGQTVILSVRVVGTKVVPTGDVTLVDATKSPTVNVATKPLNAGGRATFVLTALAPGTYTYFVNYAGDGNYPLSSSKANLLQTIVAAPGIGKFGDTSIGTVKIGAASAVIPLTITFARAETLGGVAVVTDGAPNLDFQEAGGGTCTVGQTYSANATCTLNVVFKPQLAGMRRGAVVLTDKSGNRIGTGYLGGIGEGPQIAFAGASLKTVSAASRGAQAAGADGNGNVYFINNDSALYKLTRGAGGYTQAKILSGVQARGLAFDGAGNLFLMNETEVLKQAGTSASSGTQVGSAQYPNSIAVDGLNNVYIAASPAWLPPAIYKETPSNGGYVESFVGSGWNEPSLISVDAEGSVYVLDIRPPENCADPGCIFKATVSGNSYSVKLIARPQNQVYGLAVDAAGDVYMLEQEDAPANTYLVKETPRADGSYAESSLLLGQNVYPYVFAMDPLGNAFTAINSTSGFVLSELDVADAPALKFATTAKGATSTDSPKEVTVENIGNAAMDFSAVSYPADFPEAAGASTDCLSTTLLAAGAGCTLTIDFRPESGSAGVLSEAVTFTANVRNAAGTKVPIAVSGAETIAAGSRE